MSRRPAPFARAARDWQNLNEIVSICLLHERSQPTGALVIIRVMRAQTKAAHTIRTGAETVLATKDNQLSLTDEFEMSS